MTLELANNKSDKNKDINAEDTEQEYHRLGDIELDLFVVGRGFVFIGNIFSSITEDFKQRLEFLFGFWTGDFG